MIEFCLLVPRENKSEIFTKRADNFRIITSSPNKNGSQFFLIEADEQEMIIYKLKYGANNVWKR